MKKSPFESVKETGLYKILRKYTSCIDVLDYSVLMSFSESCLKILNKEIKKAGYSFDILDCQTGFDGCLYTNIPFGIIMQTEYEKGLLVN